MPRPLVLCWNDHLEQEQDGKGVFHGSEPCRDNYRSRDPKPMVAIGETASAWPFHCQTCGWRRVWTKNFVGGTFGQGRRDDMVGTTTGKGRDRFRRGGLTT